MVGADSVSPAAKIVQVRAKQKKTPQDFHLLCRAQPILLKDSASEGKEPSLLELFAERRLSYSKIVQVSARQKKTPQDFHLLCRAPPILFKDSASERKAKEKLRRNFFCSAERRLAY